VYLLVKSSSFSHKIICAALSFMWIWAGAMYHIMYFSTINKAAYLFGLIFILQGFIFLWYGVIKSAVIFNSENNFHRLAGWLFILYAMVIYPLIGYILGHAYPQSPVFGVAPCPVTIFTFGLLLMADKIKKRLVIIPFIWSIIGFFAAISLGIREDLGLLLAGIIGTAIISFAGRIPKRTSTT